MVVDVEAVVAVVGGFDFAIRVVGIKNKFEKVNKKLNNVVNLTIFQTFSSCCCCGICVTGGI